MIEKSVLLRLRLVASEKPVLNAPAFAFIAKREGGDDMEQTAQRQEHLPGVFNGATTSSQHGCVRWYLSTPPMEKSARPAKRFDALSRTSL